MRFSRCGADGWDNTKRGCNSSYETPTDSGGRTPDVGDAPRDIGRCPLMLSEVDLNWGGVA